MATSSFGLRPIRMRNGAPWNGATVTMLIPSSDTVNYYVGDPVKTDAAGAAQLGITTNYTALGAGASQEDLGIYPIALIAVTASTNPIVGAIISFEANRSDLSVPYGKASTVRIARVAVATPDVVFECQEDGIGATLALTDVGRMVDLIGLASNASGQTNLSGWALDSSAASTTTTRQFYITGVSNRLGTPAIAATGGTIFEGFIAQPQWDISQLGVGI